MMESTTVQLPEDLLARAKQKAVAEGRTLTSLIEEGLRTVVAETPEREKKERVIPRISTAGGGLLPGVKFDTFSDYQEMEDIEYVERMKTFK